MTDVTQVLVEEHRLILRMIALLEDHTRQIEEGRSSDWAFFLEAVDFIRHFADRFHHAKEEDVLFRALVENGMPEKNSPVAAMLMAHDQGRTYVSALETAAKKARDGAPGQVPIIAENAYGYAALLRDHIAKEDGILYPLAERVLPEQVRPAIVEAYRGAANAAPGVEERYLRLVEHLETEKAA
jgi:hemerythrin-like domain-containing protein